MLITAEPPGSTVVMGVVVERDGTPAVGATVVIDTVPGRGVIADEAGRFRFEKLLSRDYQVVATKEDRLSEPTPARGQDGGEVRVVLAPAAQLAISVLDAVDDQPVPHAVVRAEAPYELRGETDSLGHSVLRPLGRGEYRVSVRASGYATAIRQMSVRGSNRPLSLVIRLQPGIDLSGQVVDSEGAGVSEARVTLMDGRRGVAGGIVLDSAWSEADGTFRFSAPPSAKLFVTAHHFHFAPARSGLVTVAEGASARVRVVMKAGAELDGSVVDRHGSPIASARVTVESDAGELFTRRECLSDSTGRFLLTGLPTGRVIASAAIDSASSRRYSLPLLPGVRKQVELMLDREGTISGRVVSAGGAPVAGAVVNVRSRTDEASRSDRKVPVFTDADGHFTIRALDPGRYRIVATRAVAGIKAGVAVVEANTDDVPVTLTLPATSSLSAQVRSVAGQAPSLADVYLDMAAPFQAQDGVIHISDIEPGRHQLHVKASGLGITKPQSFDVSAGQDVDLGVLTLMAGRTVSGRVVTEDGKPVSRAQVSLGTLLVEGDSSPEGAVGLNPDSATSGDDGSFRFSGVQFGATAIVGSHPELGRSRTVNVAAGEADVSVDLVLTGRARLHGRVLRGGQPVGQAVAVCHPVGNDAARLLRNADQEGNFEFDGLNPGKYVLMGGVGGGARELDFSIVTVDLKEGERHEQDVPLSDTGTDVTVALPESSRAAGAQVYVLDGTVDARDGAGLTAVLSAMSTGRLQIAHLYKGGAAVFRNVPSGAHSVCALLLGVPNGTAVSPDLVTSMPQLLPVKCQSVAVSGDSESLTLAGG